MTSRADTRALEKLAAAISKRLAPRFALASPHLPRHLFFVPIADVICGAALDRTSQMTEFRLRPFAFPLAFGEQSVPLDPNHKGTEIDANDVKDVALAAEIFDKEISTWCSSRRSIKALLASHPEPQTADFAPLIDPEKLRELRSGGYNRGVPIADLLGRPCLSLRGFQRSQGRSVVDYCKLLALDERYDEAAVLAATYIEQSTDPFIGDKADSDLVAELRELVDAVLVALPKGRAEYWESQRRKTIRALKLDSNSL